MTRAITVLAVLLFSAACGQRVPTAPAIETDVVAIEQSAAAGGPLTEKHKFLIYDLVTGGLVEGATVTVTISTGESFTGVSGAVGTVVLPVGKRDTSDRVQVVKPGYCPFDQFVPVDNQRTYVGIQPGC